MSATRSNDRDERLAHASSTSITQRLARVSAVHPWRILAAWGLILAASVVAIGTLLGSAFTSDGSITTNPDSVRAQQVIADNFSQADRIDDAVIIYSAELTSDDAEFKAFVGEVRSSIEATGAAETVRDPYDPDQSGISEDGHAAVVTLVLGHDAEDGIVEVIDEVVAADSATGFEVDITGVNTLDHDFTELSESDLTNGELKFGLPAAMIVLVLVFGALVAAFIPMSIAILSIIVTVAISSVLGQFTSLSFFIVNMITAMGLALGIDYSLFVLSRYREERQAGRDKVDAIIATGGTSSKAVLFSGSSFVVALLGLLLVPDTILRSLALGAIIVGDRHDGRGHHPAARPAVAAGRPGQRPAAADRRPRPPRREPVLDQGGRRRRTPSGGVPGRRCAGPARGRLPGPRPPHRHRRRQLAARRPASPRPVPWPSSGASRASRPPTPPRWSSRGTSPPPT